MISEFFKKVFNRQNLHPQDILAFLAGSLLFYFTLFNQLPLAYRNFIEFFVKENTIVLISILCFFALTYLISGWPGRSIRWLGLMWFFCVFLRGYWLINRTAFYQLYGILPWVDATEYYANAQRVILGFPMVGVTAGRPLFSTFFGSLLTYTQSNMIYSIGILVFLVAASLFIFGEYIRKEYGVVPAAFAVALTFMFYRNYLGAISSESLGLLIGLAGWIWLIIGVNNRSLIKICLGFFLVAVAFTIRAGPLVVLPMIVLGIAVTVISRKEKIRNFILVTLSGAAGFLVNSIVLKVFSSKDVVAFTSYFYSLYGMAAGGKTWYYIFLTHPEVNNLSEPIKTQKIIQLTVDLISKDPTMLIKSMLDQYVWFFGISSNSVFSFLNTNILPYNYVLQIFLYLLSIIAIILFIRNWKNKGSFLFLMILSGILLSVPLVPPQDETYMRPYAVVIPILALFPGFGMQWIINQLIAKFPIFSKMNGELGRRSPNDVFGYYLLELTVSILIFVVIVPFILFVGRKPGSISSPTCIANQKAFSWSYNKGNVMNISREVIPLDRNWISLTTARELLHGPNFDSRTQFFDNIKNGITIGASINRSNGDLAWVRMNTDLYTRGNGIYSGCGEMITDPAWYGFSVFKVECSNNSQNKCILFNGK